MPESNYRIIDQILFALYLVFFVSLIFSFRAISSISVPMILVAGIMENKSKQKMFFNSHLLNPLLFFCCLFFLIQFVSLAYTRDVHQAWRNLLLKSALIILPLAVWGCDYVNETARRKLLKWYCIILFVACAFAIFRAFQNYSVTHNRSVFLYHSLVGIYSGHAVQFSILVFVAILHLFEAITRKTLIFYNYFHISLLLFFLVFLFLLSSKLVIAYFLFYLFYTLIKSFLVRSVNKVSVAILVASIVIFSALILFTKNPVSNRFQEIVQTDFQFIKREKFSPGDYFNGLQFRLLQWQFVPEILTEHTAWLWGVNVGDAQNQLDQKYISKNMYTGGAAGRSDKGFIGYNTHNEFLQALLQSGVIGAVVFLLIAWSLIKMVWKRKRAELSFITILLLIYSFSESVFESQYSLFIFLFFPLFFYLDNNKKAIEKRF